MPARCKYRDFAQGGPARPGKMRHRDATELHPTERCFLLSWAPTVRAFGAENRAEFELADTRCSGTKMNRTVTFLGGPIHRGRR